GLENLFDEGAGVLAAGDLHVRGADQAEAEAEFTLLPHHVDHADVRQQFGNIQRVDVLAPRQKVAPAFAAPIIMKAQQPRVAQDNGLGGEGIAGHWLSGPFVSQRLCFPAGSYTTAAEMYS